MVFIRFHECVQLDVFAPQGPYSDVFSSAEECFAPYCQISNKCETHSKILPGKLPDTSRSLRSAKGLSGGTCFAVSYVLEFFYRFFQNEVFALKGPYSDGFSSAEECFAPYHQISQKSQTHSKILPGATPRWMS